MFAHRLRPVRAGGQDGHRRAFAFSMAVDHGRPRGSVVQWCTLAPLGVWAMSRSTEPQIISSASPDIEHGRLRPRDCLEPELAARVDGLVEYFWYVRWQMPGADEHVGRVLTDAAMHIVFEPGWSRVVGVVRTRFARTLFGRGQLFAARLRVGALSALCERSAHEFCDRIIALEQVLPEGRAATEAALFPLDLERSPKILASYLMDCAKQREAPPAAARVRRLVETIGRDENLCSVTELALREGLSLRQLQRMFRSFVGVTPKWVLRRARILDAARRLGEGQSLNLAELAQALGYHDQSHFARDFRSVVGRAPSEIGLVGTAETRPRRA